MDKCERRGRSSSSSSFSLSESAMFSQRIVCIDFYSAPPIRDMDVMYSEFRGYEVKRVPVLRIYGSTPRGQKTCTHVHCVFPYIYIPYDPTLENMEYRLAIALDQAINLAYGTKDAKNFHHVFKIIKVSGTSMYGYHGSKDIFLKIFFYNPWMIKKAAELLQNGVVLNKKFQPYEAHIPYHLQFLIDYNLYGMNLVHFSSVKFRREKNSKSTYSLSPSSTSLLAFTAGGGQKVWDINQIPEYLCAPLTLDKMTRCELEVDVLGSDILVADSKSAVRSSNPGIDAIWMDEMERRRQGEIENWSQITIPESQNRAFDKKRFPTEEEHMKTLLKNISAFDGPEEMPHLSFSQSSSSSFDSGSYLPSSQLNRHTPSNITFAEEARLTSTSVKPNRADEELLNLLYELENEKVHEEEKEEVGSSLGSQVVDVEDPHVTLVEECEQADDSWNESFFSETVIDEMLENAEKISIQEVADNWKDVNAMIQMDGQDDDDSSDEKNKKTIRPRRSVRISSEVTVKKKEKGNNSKAKKQEIIETPTVPKAQSSVISKTKKSAPAKLIAALTSPRSTLLRKSASFSKTSSIKETDSKANAPTPQKQKTPPPSRSSSPSVAVRSSPRISLKATKEQKSTEKTKSKSKVLTNKLKVKFKPVNNPRSDSTSNSNASTIKKPLPSPGKVTSVTNPTIEIDSKKTPITNIQSPLKNFPNKKGSEANPIEIDSKKTSNINIQTPLKNLGVSPFKNKGSEIAIRLIPCDDIVKSPGKTNPTEIPKKRGRGRPPKRKSISNILPVKKVTNQVSPSKILKSNESVSDCEIIDDSTEKLKLTPLKLDVCKIDAVPASPKLKQKCTEKAQQFYAIESVDADIEIVGVVPSPSKKISSSNDQKMKISKSSDLPLLTSDSKVENTLLEEVTEITSDDIVLRSVSPDLFPPSSSEKETTPEKEIVYTIKSDSSETMSPGVSDIKIESSYSLPLPVKEEKDFSDASCQTELPDLPTFGPLCRCLSEMVKIFNEQGTDAQTDLIRKEVKKIQTEMSDIITEMKRNGNRLTICTPSKSQSLGTPGSKSRINETPKSGRSISISSANQNKTGTPRLSPNSSIYDKYASGHPTRTPSPRKAYRKSSVSPVSSIKSQTPRKSSSFSKRYPQVSIGRVHSGRKSLTKRFNQEEVDLDINSIYEYSQEKSSPAISQFQKRRSETKARTFNRVQNRKAKLLLAFNLAPDICEYEFEPMKMAPSYKVLEKWLLTKDKRPEDGIPDDIDANIEQEKKKKTSREKSKENGDVSSDEESLVEVRRAPGGNLSDDDEDVDDVYVSNGNPSIDLFTPSPNSQFSCSSSQSNPRSILKYSSGRRLSDKAKRKIRWEDEEPHKKSKPDELRKEAIIRGASPLPLSQSSWSGFANISELDGPSPKNMFGFEHDMSNLQDAKALHQNQYLTTMCVEIHCDAREDFVPDPTRDAIKAIFIYISNDVPEMHRKPRKSFHHLIVDIDELIKSSLLSNQDNEYLPDEMTLINRFICLVNEWDPDIFAGYEIQKQSWGYIIERGTQLGMNMVGELSRVINQNKQFSRQDSKIESWNEMIPGRIVLNLWRLLRHEITVQSYTYENAAYHILHKRVHLFSYKQLAGYWDDPINRHKVFSFYYERTKGTIDIIEKLDLINRTSELARLFGIQFFEVFSRGSQFRVESMMLRVAKPKNLIAASPSVNQRAKMRAPEFLPLILEPHSNYFRDPVAVLDFQSLYPSMIIAYNYDYTTCLGRVEHLGKPGSFDFGCLDLSVSTDTLKSLKNNINISPAGVAFLESSVVKGILPEMLEQILETRQMVKRAMKRWKGEDESLLKILDSRQLGLKLIANVTYGYTSANFSGRMPCVDIADSVVSKGRETLTRAIDLVKANYERWRGDVVYGDTDSLFVRFIGRTRKEAFALAQEIADEVTQANPKPVKLKLEKVYQPCILQSKKRYVGYSYETADQEEPKYDAKGIETVRRDGCPAVRKILEKSLHILFKTNSPASVQQYVESQFQKIFLGRVSLQEFTFAREFRGRSGYKPGACVPSLEIAKKIIQKDPRAEPLASQRVPYVIVYGNPRLPLIQLVQTPMDFVNNPNLRLNAHYYIEKVIIPALNRCLLSAKMDAQKWYANLPRKYLRSNFEPKDGKQGTLTHYFTSLNCLRCDGHTNNHTHVCDTCRLDGIATSLYLHNQCFDIADKTNAAHRICLKCSEEYNKCINTDCPVFHKLIRYERDDDKYRQILSQLHSLDW